MATATATHKTHSRNNGAASAKDIEVGLKQVQKDISELSSVLTSYGKGRARAAKGTALEKSDEISQQAEQALEAIRIEAERLNKQFSEHVRRKPIQSLAIAAGVGAIVSLLLRR